MQNCPSDVTSRDRDVCITSPHDGERIDKLLRDLYPQYSRSYFQYLLEKGLILINQKAAKKGQKLKKDDSITIHFQPLPGPSLTPEAIALDILYEDDHFLAINKPVGMVVHPAPGAPTGTFVHALLHHCQNGSLPLSGGAFRPGIVHRLDKGTSGVLLAAKTDETHRKLTELFSSRQIEKSYLAICYGVPLEGVIDLPIARHPTKRKEMSILPEGRPSLTGIEVLGHNERYSVVMARPKTGRTHQIRIHLKAKHHPIVGDTTYGPSKLVASRMLLHAYQIAFIHPITGIPIRIQAPLPEELERWIKNIDPSLRKILEK